MSQPIAAVYARKSTLQERADPEAKSVSRQIANARAFATANQWTVLDSHIYSDDAVSGAETRKLVNRQRLIDLVLSGRAPFQIVIMRDQSRFSREDGDVSFGELKRLTQAGVTVWFYQDQAPFKFGTLADNMLGLMRGEFAAEYRRVCSTHGYETGVRKVHAGHVAGGRCYGYDNVCSHCGRVIPPDTIRCCREGHTEQRINATEALVIRRIFDLSRSGMGYSRICRLLNAEGAPAPRPHRKRTGVPPPGWGPSTIHEALRRDRYRGLVTWGRTKKRNAAGEWDVSARPRSDWIEIKREDLQIIPDDRWQAVHARLARVATRRTDLPAGDGTRRRRGRDIDSKYLLSGFVRCAVCGGSVGAFNRTHGHRTTYACISHHKRGATVCGNALRVNAAALEAAVCQAITTGVLRPKAVLAVFEGLLHEFSPATIARTVKQTHTEVAAIDREIANLTTAIAQGGQLTALLDALRNRQARREGLTATLTQQAAVSVTPDDRAMAEREIRDELDHWRELLRQPGPATRQLFREVLVGPVTVTPEGKTFAFEGELLVGRLIAGRVGLPTFLVRPGRIELPAPRLGGGCSIP